METNEKKNDIEALKKELLSNAKNTFAVMSDEQLEAAQVYAEDYKKFLDGGKTERECVKEAVELLEKNGFTLYSFGKSVKSGEKYYYNNRSKSLVAFIVGSEGIENGVYFSAAHIDSPRVDLKQHPLYEDTGIAYLKTHYYGGIKKYQWTTIPLSLHGVVTKKNGETVDIVIGEDDKDPVLYISDLLPHLAGEQMKKTLAEGITGEQLNLIVGSRPYDKDTPNTVKLAVMKLLNEKYGIIEDDFLSAELCAVPAVRSRDVGLDRSMIASYGHDDRVCAYPSLTALVSQNAPKHTVMAILADKEEIGSEGNSGMQSAVYFDIIADLAKTLGVSDAVVRANSKCLSSDVNAAFDPNFPSPMEKNNCCYVNSGVVITKFTGARGKSGSNDASAEFCGYVRQVLDGAGVVWQTGELGKVDAGGGGTVAKFIASKNVDVIDLGVPVLSMHAPYEVVSKNDVYMTHLGIKAFFEA